MCGCVGGEGKGESRVAFDLFIAIRKKQTALSVQGRSRSMDWQGWGVRYSLWECLFYLVFEWACY